MIPKEIQAVAGLSAGAEVEIELDEDGRVSIQPAPMEVRIEERDGIFVMVPTKPVPKLTAEEVREITMALRERRIR